MVLIMWNQLFWMKFRLFGFLISNELGLDAPFIFALLDEYTYVKDNVCLYSVVMFRPAARSHHTATKLSY